jgi:hypothetical protein
LISEGTPIARANTIKIGPTGSPNHKPIITFLTIAIIINTVAAVLIIYLL